MIELQAKPTATAAECQQVFMVAFVYNFEKGGVITDPSFCCCVAQF
jgi:hypothetical protein